MKRLLVETLRHGLLLTLAVGLAVAAPAQPQNPSFITIKGNLKDAITRKNLVFANVTVPGTHIGTVTNSDGDFTLKVERSLNASAVEFSHLGYLNRRVELAALHPTGNNIALEPASVLLDELIVRPSDARDIVANALSRIPLNYSDRPVMLTGFYREAIRQRREFISIAEAILDIYKASYTSPEADRAKLIRGRKSDDVRKADTLALKLQGGPAVSLLLDVAKHPHLLLFDRNLDQFDFELTGMVAIDGRQNYVIAFRQKPHIITPMFYGNMYIETQRLAFTMVRFGLNLENEQEASEMFVRRKPRGVRITPTSTSYLVTYKAIDGVHFFNYARKELSFRIDWRRRIFHTNYTVMAELAITDRDLDSVYRIPLSEAFRLGDILANDVAAFNDADFWGEYNYIDPDESIESAIRRYGRRLLREQ